MYPGNKRKKLWREEKERLLKMTLEERRKEYLRDYVPLKDIATWKEEMKNKAQSDEDNTNEAVLMQKSLSEKVSLYRGDITVLEIDAIVNAVFLGLISRDTRMKNHMNIWVYSMQSIFQKTKTIPLLS
uniref:Uncharacterized protein n=1 Tax=Naja naja TaxID=35670 RepID=A0A8C6XRF3_NAJNA